MRLPAATPNHFRLPKHQASFGRLAGGMFPRALGESGTIAGRHRLRGARASIATGTAALALTWGVSACGGGGGRQDVTEPSGNFPVQVAKAKFPQRQQLVETSNVELKIKNVGDQTIPDLAVTIYTTPAPAAKSEPKGGSSFDIRVDQPGLANPNRPVWILEQGYPKLITPGVTLKEIAKAPAAGAAAAQTDTFQFGAVRSGETKDIVWRVTPVRAGTYTVHYEVAAGLQGKAKAVTADGGPVKGEFPVTITSKSPETCVKGTAKVTTQCR
jgi:hypothetical protein